MTEHLMLVDELARTSPPNAEITCPHCRKSFSFAVPTALQHGGRHTCAAASNGFSIASLICGIVGLALMIPPAIAGVVLGIIALVQHKREPTRFRGRGMAIAGICTGIVGIALGSWFFTRTNPSLARAADLSKRLVCSANIKGIGTCCMIYANDYDGPFPPNLKMLVESGDLTFKQVHCPADRGAENDETPSYIYIAGQSEKDNPRNVLAYEKLENHGGKGANVLFRDGSVLFIESQAELDKHLAETEKRMAARGRRP
jgi:hypothetical protein